MSKETDVNKATDGSGGNSNTFSNNNTTASSSSRIPKTLQAVFLASNRGNEVNRPPPKKVAFKMFIRKCLGTTNKRTTSSTKDGATSTISASIDASYKKKIGKVESKSSFSTSLPTTKNVNPQTYLDDLMRSRGYCIKKYSTLKTAYRNKPTALQNASYDLHLIGIIKSGCVDDLDEILRSGISPNPCNTYGESLVHMVCRRGDQQKLQIMIQNGCDIQVADDYGRTPLHDACWAAEPAFEAVEMLLDHDLTLLQMTDCRGFLPLSYVRKDHWVQWIQFLDSKKDVYWPSIVVQTNDDVISTVSTVSEFVEQPPDSRPLPDPSNALPLDLANMVASGKIEPKQAIQMRNRRMVTSTRRFHPLSVLDESHDPNETSDTDEDDEDDDDDDDSESDDDEDDSYDDDDDDDDFSETEMSELMTTLAVRLGGPSLIQQTSSMSPKFKQ